VGGREELVERGIENGRGKEGDLYVYIERGIERERDSVLCRERNREW
jgi:hypothetical protein